MKTDQIKNTFHLSNREKKTILAFLILIFSINIIGFWLEKDPEVIMLNSENGISLDSLSLLTQDKPHSLAHIKHSDQSVKTQKRKSNSAPVSGVQKFPPKRETSHEKPLKPLAKPVNNKSTVKKEFSIRDSFDPNSTSLNDMIDLGIPKYIAQNIFNYRESGGRFKSRKDLLKMYTIDERQYQLLEKHISITSPDKLRSNLIIDVNKADQKDWESLKGIGPFYAQKILRFRNKLGGFYSINQIKETWDLPEELIEENMEFLQIKAEPRKFDLKETNFKELIAHPYINKRETKLLLKLRDITDKIDERVFIDIFGTDKWSVMKNYLEY